MKYILGHDNVDADSYFSSYILSKILRSFNINSYFTILNDYTFSLENKDIINDFLEEGPIKLNRKEIYNKNFILVDHNDINQSLKNNNCNILFSIDHHIDTKQVEKCYAIEYTSTLLYIYYLFKDKYKFSYEDKVLIALSVMADSEYLTSTRFKESDKKLYDELNVKIAPKEIRNKYFKTTDFNLNIIYNINNSYKSYNIENININRIILKGYCSNRYNIKEYLNKINDIYDNNIFIIGILDDKRYKEELEKKLYEEYLEVLESSGKDRIEELADMLEIIKALSKLENSSLEEVIEVSKEKVKKRGAFDKKIYLEKVIGK